MKVGEYFVYISGKNIADVSKTGDPKLKEELKGLIQHNAIMLINVIGEYQVNEIRFSSSPQKFEVIEYKRSWFIRLVDFLSRLIPTKSSPKRAAEIDGRKYFLTEVGD